MAEGSARDRAARKRAGAAKQPAPPSLREAMERSLEDRAASVLRASLKRMTTEQMQRAVAAPTAAGTVVEVLSASPEVGLQREPALLGGVRPGRVPPRRRCPGAAAQRRGG